MQSQCHQSYESMTMDNASHLLHKTLDKLKSSFSNRLMQPSCLKERHRKLFLPGAIRHQHSLRNKQIIFVLKIIITANKTAPYALTPYVPLTFTSRYLSILFYLPQYFIFILFHNYLSILLNIELYSFFCILYLNICLFGNVQRCWIKLWCHRVYKITRLYISTVAELWKSN